MYVRVQINGKSVMTMLDTGPTHNFMADREIQKPGLTLAQHSSRIKVMNSETKLIQGVACVESKVGAWIDKCNLMVVPLDEFDGTYVQDSVRSAEKKGSFMSTVIRACGSTACTGPCGVSKIEETVGRVVGGRADPAEQIWFTCLFQRKQDGSMRMCVDYRALNKVTIKNKYPTLNTIDLFDKLTKAKYYAKIDFRSGYWQVHVARGDEPKTTRFIKGYSKIVNPLTDLLRKDKKWERTVACDDAFRSLKQAISSQPVLKLPQFDKPFEVQVNASDRALGDVLVQDKHLIAFESR
ncbi:UNVERIFIED_CONTAM: RNA-directed DNA polymerase [Sesamum calycinum]|uniref:RNA-directed DNA polymerase n=1 Tax=Sesamum calycinum TaxID=2727403 RepID=A0AAW2NS46_9LAMI